MTSPQGARIGKISRAYVPINNSLTIQQVRLSSSDIEQWRTAIDTAKSVTNPRRKLLYELYENIEIDGHLLSVMNKRRTQITNKRVNFILKDNEGGIDDTVTSAILETPWFYDMIKYILESKAYGHSLIELIPDKGIVNRAELIPRMNVIPEKGMLAFNAMNPNEGVLYREDPIYSNHLIEAGGKKSYGLLMSAAQYVIYKRGGFGDWSQFAELFGMPFREGNYQPHDEYGRAKITEALQNMGGAAYVVTPEGTSIKFHDNNGTGKSEVFKDLIEMCDAQISKIFLGNTMTTDNGSSRSQGEVHQDSEEGIILSDMIELEYMLNWTIKDKLIALGLPIPDGRFLYPDVEKLSLDKRIEMDIKLSEKVEIADEYWYKTYNIPKPDSSAKPVVIPKKEEKSPDNADKNETSSGKKAQAKKSSPEKTVTASIDIDQVNAYQERTNALKDIFEGMKEINSVYSHSHGQHS